MDSLAYVVGQEDACLQLFIAALSEEQTALKTGNTDTLEEIVGRKNRQIEQLGRLGQQRNQLLKSAGYPEDREGIEAWSRAAGKPELIVPFLARIDEARELNRLNGQLIALRLAHTQSALAALTPHRAAGQGLYGPKGQTSFSTGYRLIDKV